MHRRTVQKRYSWPRYHDGVITHLEPDILECEVKWALESITTNKASGGDGIPVELFQILKMMLWKCCSQYVSKFGNLSSGHKTGKDQFSSQSQRKAMPKNVSVQFSRSVVSDSLWHHGFPVCHQLLELTQTHVHRVGDAIQPSHPLSSPPPPAFNLS